MNDKAMKVKTSNSIANQPLLGRNIVLGVSGGIAAYKSLDIVSRLRKLGASVFVLMTNNACNFVNPLAFEAMSTNPVVTDTFQSNNATNINHISLATKADIFLVAPATANVLAKIAHGIADDMLTTTLLATRAPILIAPAMNTYMWQANITQENVSVLKRRNILFIGPEDGFLAEGQHGPGRMSEPVDIVNKVLNILAIKQLLKNKKVLVTAGPTQEPLDPVRYITNRSSGKMGYALAKICRDHGAKVTLVTGPTYIPIPSGMEKIVHITTTLDLYDSVTSIFEDYDLIIQAAAPSDYRLDKVYEHKIKKADNNDDSLSLKLVENPDIAYAISSKKRDRQIFVGFAAETRDLLKNAKRKLFKKNLDLIVANDVTKPGAGFDVDTNIVTLITKDIEIELPLASKEEVAQKIVDFLHQQFFLKSDKKP